MNDNFASFRVFSAMKASSSKDQRRAAVDRGPANVVKSGEISDSLTVVASNSNTTIDLRHDSRTAGRNTADFDPRPSEDSVGGVSPSSYTGHPGPERGFWIQVTGYSGQSQNPEDRTNAQQAWSVDSESSSDDCSIYQLCLEESEGYQ